MQRAAACRESAFGYASSNPRSLHLLKRRRRAFFPTVSFIGTAHASAEFHVLDRGTPR